MYKVNKKMQLELIEWKKKLNNPVLVPGMDDLPVVELRFLKTYQNFFAKVMQSWNQSIRAILSVRH